MLRRLRCRRLADGRYERPSEATLRRMLGASDITQLERQLGDWLHTQSLADEPVALDGKTLRGSRAHGRARHLVSAFPPHSHRGRAPGRGARARERAPRGETIVESPPSAPDPPCAPPQVDPPGDA